MHANHSTSKSKPQYNFNEKQKNNSLRKKNWYRIKYMPFILIRNVHTRRKHTIIIISSWISIDGVITLDCTFFLSLNLVSIIRLVCVCVYVFPLLYIMCSFPNCDSKSILIVMLVRIVLYLYCFSILIVHVPLDNIHNTMYTRLSFFDSNVLVQRLWPPNVYYICI